MDAQNKTEVPSSLHLLPAEDFIKFFTQSTIEKISQSLESANQASARRFFRELPAPLLNKLIPSLPAQAIGRLILRTNGATLESYFNVASHRASSALLKAVTSPRSRKKVLAAIEAVRQPSPSESDFKYSKFSENKEKIKSSWSAEDLDSFLSGMGKQLSEEQAEKLQYRIETKVPQFVTKAAADLDSLRLRFEKKASNWAKAGMTIMTVALLGLVALTLYGLAYGPTISTWPDFAFVTFKGLVIAVLLSYWAKHAFSISNAYSHEAIKRSDRAHAINFGKLYLELYGNTVDRTEVVRVFENWNLETDTAFAKVSDKGLDSSALTKIAELGIDLIKSNSKKGKDE